MSTLSEADLDALVEEATVDAHDDEEQVSGLFTMIQDNLQVPFETSVLGVTVAITTVDLRSGNQIVAICVRDGHRQAISVLDLPLPNPPPDGSEWIEAYRRWTGEG